MSIRVDKVQLEIEVREHKRDAELVKLNKELGDAGRSYRNLQNEMDKLIDKQKTETGLTALESQRLSELTVEVDKAKQAYQELDKKKTQYVKDNKLETMTIYELSQEYKQYKQLINNLDPNSDYYEKTQQYLKALKDRMAELNIQTKNTQSSLMIFAKNFSYVVSGISNALDIKDRIVNWADQYVQSFAKMDDAMTDVMKYTGQTKREVEEMNETFKQMTTRTPREELNALAGAAGRLGIQGKKDIEGFVDAADKINVALGDDLGEGAIDQIGKLTMVFGEDKTKGLNGAMLATGSAINVLGASSSANTGFITEFTSRMAGMAVNAKISQTDIMGYASALSQAGIEGETASGVFAQMITKMFTDPARFAKAAGLEVKSFTELLKTDANQAILQFLQGLKQNGGFESLAPALKSLKMQGTQAVPVISSLINKMDELKTAQDTAKKAYDDGTSIIEEFNNANSSAAAQLEIAQKKLNDVSVELGQKLMPIVEGGISAGTTTIKIISTLVSWFTKFAPIITTLTATIVALTVAENAQIIKSQLMVFWNEKVKESSLNLWKVLKNNPYIVIAGLVTTLAVAMYNLFKQTNSVAAAQKALNKIRSDAADKTGEEEAAIHSLIRASKSETLSKEDKLAAIDKLQKKIPGYITELNKETGVYKENKKALDEYLASLSKKYEIEGAKDRLKEIGRELAQLRIEQQKAQKVADNAQKNRGNGHSYTTSWGSVGDTAADAADMANDRLDRANKALENKLAERQQIYDTFGKDLISSVATGSNNDGLDNDGSGDGGGGGTTTDKERDKQRKEAEARLKADFEREKILLKQQYQEKKELKDEWQLKEVDAERSYLDKLMQVRKQYGATESELMEVQNQTLDTIAKEANIREEARKRDQQQKLKDIDQQQAADELLLVRQQLTGEISTQREYDERKLQCEIDYQKKRLEVLTEGSDEYRAAQNRLEQLGLEQLKQQQSAKKDDQNWNNNALQSSFGLMGSFDTMREANQAAYDQDLINFQQYQQNKTQIAEQEEQSRQQIQQAAFDAVNGLTSSAGSLFSALQQRETSQVEKKYKKQIEAAKKSGKDTTKLEEQMEAEKTEIQKKYAQKQFKLQILQIVSNTAQGISKTIAEWGMPAAIPFVATAAAQGAMQLATAKAQADAAAGLYEGGYSEGYTEKGNPKEQAGVIPVHKNEFVANHKAVANSQIRPVLDVIDRHQKAGDIQMLDATRMLEEAYGRGRYRGGYSSGGDNGSEDDQTTPSPSYLGGEQLALLREIRDNTADSLTVRELRKEIKHQERLEANAGR